MSVGGHRIKAAFKYPKYLTLFDQSLLKNHEGEVNYECVSYYVRRQTKESAEIPLTLPVGN